MRLLLLIVYLALYIIRPTEWVTGIIGTPLLMIVGIIALVAILCGVVTGQSSNVLSGNVEIMMFGFISAICFSHMSHGYVGGAINSIDKFLPSITGFFLVLTSINDRKRLQLFIMLLIVLASFIGYEGVRQFITGYAHGGLEPIYEQANSLEDAVKLVRIRWYGVFNDPNDVGLLFVLSLPFLLDMVIRRSFIVPLVCLPLIVSALYYTNSRGSMLAAIASICAYFVIRYKSILGLSIGLILAFSLFVLGPSRMAGISSEEESAHGRIDAWYQGYQMFKSNPLFGVGQGHFTDYNELTAHNSFVLVMAETGYIGLFFFTGLIYYPLNWLWISVFRSVSGKYDIQDLGIISSTFASFIRILVAIFFISRAYMLVPFILIALTTLVCRITLPDNELYSLICNKTTTHFKNIFLITILQILIINIVVKISL